MSTQFHPANLDVSYLSPFQDASPGETSPDVMARPARTPLQDGDPRRAGRYRLTARLGAGGMGLVYLGVGEDGRLVAVKVMRPDLAGNLEFRARFSREVAVLTRVRGAGIVRVIEAGTDACGPFLVTEYAAGPTLASHVESAGPLDSGTLHDLAAGLAEALTAIHTAGVVHRDLKPSNVILTIDGPKVIDFGIAQALDSVSLTGTGMTVGSAGFMAPEQVMGKAGPAADIFSWALNIAYAASGEPPFGTGPIDAVMYRVMHAEPCIDAVPEALRPAVQAALAREPQDRPAAHEILDQLTGSPAVPGQVFAGLRLPTVLSPADQPRGSWAIPPAPPLSADPPAPPLSAGSPGTEPGTGARPGTRRGRAVPRAAKVAVPALAVVAAAGLALALLPGHGGKAASPAGGTGASRTLSSGTFGTYPGQQSRGVFGTISRIASYGGTTVTTGSQVSDGVSRPQFLYSADGGASWHRAPVRLADGGQPPLGAVATRVAGGPQGWVAISTTGTPGTWTSTDGRSWTQVATHGIAPQRPGDQVWVLTATANGFLAAGQAKAADGAAQAVIWTSPDGVTWQRSTLAGAASISWAAAARSSTVISGQLGNGAWQTWASSDGGSTWTPVTVPAGPGAGHSISGVASDGSGLIAVRPGPADDALVYFSPNGLNWRYAATIGATGGLRPAAVRGSADGFVVTGSNAAGDYVAYASTGAGTSWLPTGSLGGTASYASAPSATAGPDGTVIAAGSSAASHVSQQGILLRASTSGAVQAVSLTHIPGAVLPEVSVKSLAVAGGMQIAVGSADGYPAIWQQTSGRWRLVSTLAEVSAEPGLGTLTSVTHESAGWLAVGVPGPVAFTSANGRNWQPDPAIGRDLSSVTGNVVGVAAAAGPLGYVIVGKVVAPGGGCVADVWTSKDLTSWTHAGDVNDDDGSSQVLAVAAGPQRFVSVGSYEDKPAVWTTADGVTWKTISLPLPAGATSGVLQQVAMQGSRVVALGQQVTGGVTTPLAELSANGGASWTPVPFGAPGADTSFTALTADSGGFTAAAQSASAQSAAAQSAAALAASARGGAPGQQAVTVWTSPDGMTWTASAAGGLPGSGTSEVTTLAGAAGGTVTAVGAAASQDSQQPLVRTFADR